MLGTNNWKFHLAAGSVTILISVLLFSFFAPDDKPDTVNNPAIEQHAPTNSDRFIQVSRASYGLNCNEQITRVRAAAKRDPNRFLGVKVPELAEVNNVLRLVSGLCDGKSQCSIDVSPVAMGINPMEGCTNILQVEYRCYTLDRPWPNAAPDYGTVQLDCTDK